MGSESIAHEASWAIDSEPIRARAIIPTSWSKKYLSLVKAIVLVFKAGAFRY